MLTLTIFSIHDSKAEAFIQPYYAPNRGTGERMFADAANDPQTQFHKHAADYTLFELGHFDSKSAEIKLHPTPINLGLALQFQTNEIPLSETPYSEEKKKPGSTNSKTPASLMNNSSQTQ